MLFPPRPGRARRGSLLALLAGAAGAFAGSSAAHAAPWVVITEIQYNPLEGDAGEFIEILSREPPRADLSGWTIEGEIRFRFPQGTMLHPGEHLVVARDLDAFQKRYPAMRNAVGPFEGKLDNRRGRLVIRNAGGARVCEARWQNGWPWPSLPDGTGHTLSLIDPHFDPSRARNWKASELPGGTPGAMNFGRSAAVGTLLVEGGEAWKYFPGESEPDSKWTEIAFKAEGWASGPTGIGYGDGDDSTEIPEMRGKYLSLFARKSFQVPDPAGLSRLVLRIDWDDGFVAHLNGKEVARANLGREGTRVAFNQPATRHEAGVPAELDLGLASSLLRAGENVLAVQVHNDNLTSSDLTLWVELESRKAAEEERRGPRLLVNEASAPGAAGEPFVEIYNAGDTAVDLGGLHVTDDPAEPRKYPISGTVPLAPRGFAALGKKELGEKFALAGKEGFAALVSREGDRFLDAIRLAGESAPGGEDTKDAKKKDGKKDEGPARPAGPQGASAGRYPDGGRKAAFLDPPTPGAPNRAPCVEDIVINEIQYNPVDKDDEFIELHNRGKAEIDVGGFRLSGGCRFEVLQGTKVAAGGFLVIAREPDALAKKFNLPRERVLGPLEGSLSNGGEELVLRHANGNIADSVEYGDAAPWPEWPDGQASSLELIDPFLDNSLPGAWTASDDSGRAKWQTFSYTKEHRTFKGTVPHSEFQVLLLDQGECLIDDFRLRGESDLIPDGGFEKGNAAWKALGTHERSGIHKKEGARGKACYRIVADGRGNIRRNNVSIEVPGLAPGRRYQVSFKAKWVRGSQTLLTRSAGQGIAKAHRLPIPATIGTPGAENSTRVRDAAPIFETPTQEPVVPPTDVPVRFAARISSTSPVASASLRFRPEGAADWTETALLDDGRSPDAASGDGVWSGRVPALPAGSVEFSLHATDAKGKEGRYPREGAALYAVGVIPPGRMPSYTLLMSPEDYDKVQLQLSNRLHRGTLVYGDSRIFHDIGFRPRGSPFTRSRGRNWRIVFGEDDLDGRGTLTLDGQNGDGTNLNERLTYWLLEQIHAPNVRQQYVYFRFPGKDEEGIYEDVEKIDGSFLSSWFGDADPAAEARGGVREKGAKPRAAAVSARKKAAAGEEESRLYKVDDYFDLSADENQQQDYDEADVVYVSEDPEDYRWNFTPRVNKLTEDFGPLVKLLQVLDPRAYPEKGFDDRIDAVIDTDEWLRVLAARTFANDWDTLGLTRGKNSMLYYSARDGLWRLLPWDCDLSWSNSRTALFSTKFPGIRRFIDRPANRRKFLAYLSYLASAGLDPASFEQVLADLNFHSGARTQPFRDFGQDRRQFILSQIPSVELRVGEVRRVERAGSHDIARATGTAPIPALRFRLNGREGAVRFLDMERWTAEFPLGPEGGSFALEALDFGRRALGSAVVKVKARANAPPLPEEPPAARFLEGRGAALAEAPPEPPPGRRPKRRATTKEEDLAATPVVPPDAVDAMADIEAAIAAPAPVTGTKAPAESPDALFAEERAALEAMGKRAVERSRAEDLEAKADLVPEPDLPEEGEDPVEDPEAAGAPAAAPAGAPATDPGPPPAAPKSRAWIAYAMAGVIVALGAALSILLLLRGKRRSPGEKRPAAVTPGKPAKSPAQAAARRPAPGSAERTLSAPAPVVAAIQALGSPRFEKAAHGLAILCSQPDIPTLLDALEDTRKTPFQKIRRSPEGFTALPADMPSEIRVRHIAALLLERALGKPPVPRPTRADWEALWRKKAK